MVLEMKVKGLALDPLSNMPMIILRDEEEKRSLPIWVGLFEANAIALELEKIPTPRPLTHDLIKNILETVEARVQKVVVNDLRDNTFYAVIHLQMRGSELQVDSRPSDAIALALRVGAPIFVEEDVVHKARSVEVAKETSIGSGKGDDQAKIKEVQPLLGGLPHQVARMRVRMEKPIDENLFTEGFKKLPRCLLSHLACGDLRRRHAADILHYEQT